MRCSPSSVDTLPGCKEKIGCGQRFVCGGLYWTLCHQIRPDPHITDYMLEGRRQRLMTQITGLRPLLRAQLATASSSCAVLQRSWPSGRSSRSMIIPCMLGSQSDGPHCTSVLDGRQLRADSQIELHTDAVFHR